ncbi:MAG: ribosome maturation factor RimM [Syntrophorhabdales bacterium]|jgi:16S rRNA processing protein RimM
MKFIPVGRVVSTHGLRGEVKFRYYNESSTASLQYPTFFADRSGTKIELKPSRIRPQGDLFLISFRGLEAVEDVRFLLRGELFVREDDLPPLEEGEYYDYQLIGLTAVTEQGRRVGTVKDVMHTGANDILVVEGASDVLVPMTEDHIITVSREDGFVRVREAGLVE